MSSAKVLAVDSAEAALDLPASTVTKYRASSIESLDGSEGELTVTAHRALSLGLQSLSNSGLTNSYESLGPDSQLTVETQPNGTKKRVRRTAGGVSSFTPPATPLANVRKLGDHDKPGGEKRSSKF